jgi:hypothetical protein
VSVTVTTTGGTSGPVTYTYVTPPPAAPTLSAIAPTSGTTAGGTAVTLTGTNLTGTSVSFGGTAASGAVVNAGGTSITATTPAHAAGAVSVTVTTTGGTSGPVTYTYTAPSTSAPKLTAISPASGSTAGGTTVTLTGTNLTNATVSFGGSAARVISSSGDDGHTTTNSSTSITVRTPAHAAGKVSVTATTANGTSNALSFTYGSTKPVLTSLSPTHGPTSGGTSVTLSGSNLLNGRVLFGGALVNVTSSSATRLTVRTPRHSSGRVSVTVQTSAGTSNALNYSYDSRSSDDLSSQISESVLPVSDDSAPQATIASNSVLSIRVTSGTPVDPASVSATLTTPSGSATGGVWRPTTPGDDTDGWVMFTPEQPLTAGATVSLTASAQAVDGTPIEPITKDFKVAGQESSAQASDTPTLDDATDAESPDGEKSMMSGMPAYRMSPGEVFSTPVTMQIPVPQGVDPGSMAVYYQSLNPMTPGWHLAQNVTGWMVPGSMQIVKSGSQMFIQIQVNHAGMVKLGMAPTP